MLIKDFHPLFSIKTNELLIQSNETPQFIEFLSKEDKQKYYDLRKDLWNLENKFKRNKRLESLQKALDKIHDFCVQNDDNDWKRSIVCGVIWFDQGIAINTRQLKILINKCKSSINGALLKMGYTSSTTKGEGFDSLLRKIPYLRGNFVEQRMWTVRKKSIATPMPERGADIFDYNEFQTPQPHIDIQKSQLTTQQEINKMFNIDSQADETNKISSCEPDFFLDPVCCCPVSWVLADDDDDFTTYG